MSPPPEPPHSPPELAGDWQLDAEPVEPSSDAPEIDSPSSEPIPHQDSPNSPSAVLEPPPAEVPPSPEQLIEAMIFVGGPPLTASAACAAIRGLTSERFHMAVDVLSRRYRRQQRPYAIQAREGGFVLAVAPAFRGLREKLFGGPKEARLGQAALDVLSVVAYRQPVAKAEVDAVRGVDSGALLRQLVRLGLVAVQHRAEGGGRSVHYGTTARFLQVFGLGSLDELPRLGDTSQV